MANVQSDSGSNSVPLPPPPPPRRRRRKRKRDDSTPTATATASSIRRRAQLLVAAAAEVVEDETDADESLVTNVDDIQQKRIRLAVSAVLLACVAVILYLLQKRKGRRAWAFSNGVIEKLVEKLEELANTIKNMGREPRVQNWSSDLRVAVWSLEGDYSEEILDIAFSYLLNTEARARFFIYCDDGYRRSWMDMFHTKQLPANQLPGNPDVPKS